MSSVVLFAASINATTSSQCTHWWWLQACWAIADFSVLLSWYPACALLPWSQGLSLFPLCRLIHSCMGLCIQHGVLLQWILVFNLHQPSTECWCWLEERPDVVLSAYPPHSITQFYIGYKWKWLIDTAAEYGSLVMVSDLSTRSRCPHHCEGLDIEMNTNISIFPSLVKAFPQEVSVNFFPFYRQSWLEIKYYAQCNSAKNIWMGLPYQSWHYLQECSYTCLHVTWLDCVQKWFHVAYGRY